MKEIIIAILLALCVVVWMLVDRVFIQKTQIKALEDWASKFRGDITGVFNDMKEYNPYEPLTDVLVFSQGSEADDWMQTNCDKCTKSATCPLRYDILHSSDPYYCRIPLCPAKRIGMDYEALYRSGNLYWRCLEFDNGRDAELNFLIKTI